jgi:hypothetical protein
VIRIALCYATCVLTLTLTLTLTLMLTFNGDCLPILFSVDSMCVWENKETEVFPDLVFSAPLLSSLCLHTCVCMQTIGLVLCCLVLS